MSDYSFRWLHLSDLHAGMSGQTHLWNNLKHRLYDDLPSLFEIAGRPDLVIFSGDIVQKGHSDEYKRATEILVELWERLTQLGAAPTFFAVPGNHDLVRPASDSMPVMLLGNWATNPTVRTSFLTDPASDYRTTVVHSLENYRQWYESLPDVGIPTMDVSSGFLPGDMAGILASTDHQVGIVGLNSTWLQLTATAKAGDMHVDALQLAEVLDDAEGWCRKNDFNLVVSHHPTLWLGPSAQEQWRTEIAPPERFDLHLYGHMHEANTTSISEAGSSPVHEFQSPSLFGMEKLADGTTERRHGYSAGEFVVTGGNRSVRLWPRVLTTLSSGQMKVIPDHKFNLRQDAFTIQLPAKVLSPKGSPVVEASGEATNQISDETTLEALPAEEKEKDVLGRFRHNLMPAAAHASVRKVEQEQCKSALRARGVWLVAEWGMSGDEFLSSVLLPASSPPITAYRLDLGEISPSHDLEEAVELRLGLTLQTLSAHLDRLDKATLILDDIALGDRTSNEPLRESSIEKLAQTLIDYCDRLTVVMRTRSDPIADLFDKVTISALDEAEVASYITFHPDGGEDLATQDVVAQLYGYTGGVPSRLDRALKSLKVVPLSDLVSGDVDDALAVERGTGLAALKRSLEELNSSEDDSLKRALSMLKVLTTYPHGAEFHSIRRFHGAKGFYEDNANELLQRAFVTASAVPGLSHTSRAETKKILEVPRPVRDFVRQQMSDDEIANLNRRAADLSFGEDWRSGGTSWPAERKYSSSTCPSHEVSNASAILIRMLRAAVDDEDEDQVNLLAGLGARFSDALISGDHFYGATRFCMTFLQIAAATVMEDDTLTRVRINYARALRMIGNRSQAIERLQELKDIQMEKGRKEIVLIDLALAYQSDNDLRATEIADELYKRTKNPYRKLQARSIIIDQDKKDPDRQAKLISLEREARRKGSTVVANNIALDLASEINNSTESAKYLNAVVSSGREAGDFYNEIRAYIDIADRRLQVAGKLENHELIKLIAAYQYLFNQRIPSLFDKCHRLLWSAFDKLGQSHNLLALFRNSSFIWRIRGVENKEKTYLDDLSRRETLVDINGGRDLNYFKARQTFDNSQRMIAP
jgi:predicted MPP superfamily phosphohydrolase